MCPQSLYVYVYVCLSLFSLFSCCCRSVLPLFGYPTYEVSASYIKQSAELDMKCQPGGGGVEFRQGNLSGIQSFTIESGSHGNIQLLPPGVGPCRYRVTVSELLSFLLHLSMPNHLCFLLHFVLSTIDIIRRSDMSELEVANMPSFSQSDACVSRYRYEAETECLPDQKPSCFFTLLYLLWAKLIVPTAPVKAPSSRDMKTIFGCTSELSEGCALQIA